MQRKPKTNTRFFAFVATSVDGRISLSKNILPDWTSREDWRFLQQSLLKIDSVIVGRNTFEAAKSRLQNRNTYVFSGRLKTIRKRGKITFLNPRKVNIEELFGKYRTVAVLGGSMVYGLMLKNNLLDEIFVTIEPLVFGKGKEMIKESGETKKLKLLSVKQLNKRGTLLLRYQIKKI